eukprot:TRINITY_DN9427_c0_g2_i1.p1 TRINITY_DN9427_c0_g2~~TRINITY_DN9427_c0_g2_i1.p1  ORF type:complete len:374 (+),score=48.19 TRINITY_DN9427_c0_g2_i1:38-1123(+)
MASASRGIRLVMIARPARLSTVALVCCGCGLPGFARTAVASIANDEIAEIDDSADSEGEDPWARLTTEEWQPGRVGDNTSMHNIKDIECTGPQTQMVSDSDLGWHGVKALLYDTLSDVNSNLELKAIVIRIHREEPDACVLGIATTQALLLPITMPKFRNMARVLENDQNMLILNVTFFDTLRSGFPMFGVLDGLATNEFREWFESEEGFSFFPPRRRRPACETAEARSLLDDITRARVEGSWGSKTPAKDALTLLAVSGADSGDTHCPLAAAAACLIVAMVRAETAPAAWRVGGSMEESRESAVRDVIELVSRAEEFVRFFSGSDGISFAELVASPWSICWLLHRLQLTLSGHLFHNVVL